MTEIQNAGLTKLFADMPLEENYLFEEVKGLIRTAFELGLKLGSKGKKKKHFKRPAGHPEGCLCEICFAPVHEAARKL
jgi:hypothetical protein